MARHEPGAPRLVTFGCRLNAYESEVIRDHALKAGLVDAVIVNTCAVTAEAERQARQAIRRARRDHPESEIIVTGCAAQIDPARYAAMAEVDRVIGNAEKLRPETYAQETGGQTDTRRTQTRVAVSDIMAVTETACHLIDGFGGRARAFIQVQNGCDHRCTFCIIPFGRGNSRSVPPDQVVDQIRHLVARGCQEVVLSGVDITAYGADLADTPSLGRMVRRVLADIPDLPRLRLGSIDPAEADDDLLDAIAEEPRLMPHLHLSLQSGDDIILKRMKRRHSRAGAIAFAERVRRLRPDMVLGADIIAGFPTETDSMFANSRDIVAACDLTYLHVFPFSARPGTPAARMPPLPRPVVKQRAAELRALAGDRLADYLAAQIGSRTQVLAETSSRGHTPHFAPITLQEPVQPGAILAAEITGASATELAGRAAA